MPADPDTRPLGRTGIDVLPLGIGTNKWRRADRGAVLETYRTIHDAGPCMINTAEIYFSERVVGNCLRAGPTRAVIATKFFPFPGRSSPRRLMHGLDGSLARLGLKTIDLYYVHFPPPLMDLRVFAEGLVEAVKSGKARAVGVANFNADQMRRIAGHLARAGVPLAANQVNYSLLRRAAETNGVPQGENTRPVPHRAHGRLRGCGRLTQPSDSMGTKALLTCLADIAVGTMSRTWRIRRSSYGCVSIFGDHARSILVGMKKERPYPEEIEGQQALFVVNLAPRKVAGEISEGLLFDIGYADEITPVLAQPEKPVPNGTRAG